MHGYKMLNQKDNNNTNITKFIKIMGNNPIKPPQFSSRLVAPNARYYATDRSIPIVPPMAAARYIPPTSMYGLPSGNSNYNSTSIRTLY